MAARQTLAILHHRADIVTLLCARGQNPNSWPEGGYVPDAANLFDTSETGKVAYLPRDLPPVPFVSSPLELALWLATVRRAAGHPEPLAAAAALVRAGADVNHLERATGVPLLHRRVVQGDDPGALFLLESTVCKVDQVIAVPAPLPELVPAAEGAAAIDIAATADATPVSPGSTTTVLIEAARRNMVDVVRAILARPEAPINICASPSNDTALHIAVRLRHAGAVSALLRRPPSLTLRCVRAHRRWISRRVELIGLLSSRSWLLLTGFLQQCGQA